MHCYICGTEKNLVVKNFRHICRDCSHGMPKKVSRESFDKAYWQGKVNDVPNSIKREFYADYMASYHTLAAYIEETTTRID